MSQKTKKKIKIESYDYYNLKGNPQVKARKKAVLIAIGDSLGHIGHACKQANISQRTHERWKKEDSEYERAFEDNLNYMKDEFEYLLKKKAYAGDTRAIIFFLKTKCKDRGYTENTEEKIKQWEPREIPIQLNFNHESEEQFRKMQEEINRKKEKNHTLAN